MSPLLRRAPLLLVLALAIFTAAACSSAAPAGPPPFLRGVYNTSAGAGDFAWVDFTDAEHYVLWKNAPCSGTYGSDASCGHTGTYAISAAGDTVTLTDAETSHVTSIGMQGLSLGADPSTQSLHVLGGTLTGSDAGALVGNASLVSGPAPIASFTATNLVTKTQQKLTASADVSLGAFAECSLPAPLKPVLGQLLHLVESRGIELSAEFLIVYSRDLSSGSNSLEILFGGAAALVASEVVGVASGQLHGLLSSFGANAGLLAGATVSLDFDGTFGNVHFSLDAYSGGDLFAASGGRWKVIWSQDSTETGETGYWASVTVVNSAVCKGGFVVFASDSAVSVLWNLLTGGPPAPPSPPVCGVPASGIPKCDSCLQSSCCAQAQSCSGTMGCGNLYQCYGVCAGDWACTAGCNLGAPKGARGPAEALQNCMTPCSSTCGTSFAGLVTAF